MSDLSDTDDRIAELEARLYEVQEIYAGMEGWIPRHASDAYALRIIQQMYSAAKGETA